MIKILFICTGNTCRSPMAEVILKNKIKCAGIKGVKVQSAGLTANAGDKMSKNSVLALKNLGYSARRFSSTPVSALLLLKSDLIICMTEEHKRAIRNYPNVYSVSEFTGVRDIIDPYGQELSEYVKASHLIEDACNIIIEKLIEGEIK